MRSTTLILALLFANGCGSCVEEKPEPPAAPEPPVVVRRKLKDGGRGPPQIIDHAEGRGVKAWEAGPNDEVLEP